VSAEWPFAVSKPLTVRIQEHEKQYGLFFYVKLSHFSLYLLVREVVCSTTKTQILGSCLLVSVLTSRSVNLMGRMLQLCFTLEGLSRAVLLADFSHLSWLI
jgi:hypothetical protein